MFLNIIEEKKRLRKSIKNTFDDLNKDKSVSKGNLYDQRSEKIINNLLKLKIIKESNSINCYVSCNCEVNTKKLVRDLIKLDKKVSVPCIEEKEDSKISLSIINSETNYIKSCYGILEPLQKEYIDKNEIDVFIIPGLAFDLKLNRLGRGKGFYDKLLQETRGTKIGISFEEQVFDKIPFEEHDIKMDILVTEKRIIGVKELIV